MATVLSLAAFIPVALTWVKFETTKSVYRDAPATSGPSAGTIVRRNAWPADSKLWPTVVYTIVGGLAFVLDAIVLGFYAKDVRHANQAAKVASTFGWIVRLGNLGVWIAAAAMYRYEKNLHGKSNDLWGWACSPEAQKIQKAFDDEVQFNPFCVAQVGLAQPLQPC